MHLESRLLAILQKLLFSTSCESITCCLIRYVFLFFFYFPFVSFPVYFSIRNTQTNNFLNASARFLVQHVIIVACVHCRRSKLSFVCPYCLLSLYVYVRLSVASTLKRCNSSQKREFHQKRKKKKKEEALRDWKIARKRKTHFCLSIDIVGVLTSNLFSLTLLFLYSTHPIGKAKRWDLQHLCFCLQQQENLVSILFRITPRHCLRSCLWVTSFACIDLSCLSFLFSLSLSLFYLIIILYVFSFVETSISSSLCICAFYVHSWHVMLYVSVCWSRGSLWLRSFLFYVELTRNQFHAFTVSDHEYEHEYMPAVDIHSLTISLFMAFSYRYACVLSFMIFFFFFVILLHVSQRVCVFVPVAYVECRSIILGKGHWIWTQNVTVRQRHFTEASEQRHGERNHVFFVTQSVGKPTFIHVRPPFPQNRINRLYFVRSIWLVYRPARPTTSWLSTSVCSNILKVSRWNAIKLIYELLISIPAMLMHVIQLII